MKVECVDDKYKPEDISNKYWIVKGRQYTVIEVLKDMNFVEYYKLEEIPLEQAKTLYKGFASSRFKILDGGVDTIIEELIKELEIELV